MFLPTTFQVFFTRIYTTFDDSFGGGIGNGGIGSNSGSGQFDDDFF